MATLAQCIGETQHLSPLMKKMERVGFANIEDLKALAIFRGCNHYKEDEVDVVDPGLDVISDQELGVSLLLGSQEFDPKSFRIAVQLISRLSDPHKLFFLCKKERCESVIAYIASCGMKVEETNSFWKSLYSLTEKISGSLDGVLPHWSRFVRQTGISNPFNPSKKKIEWIR